MLGLGWKMAIGVSAGRFAAAAIFGVAEFAAVMAMSMLLAEPVTAQLFDDRFPWLQQRPFFGPNPEAPKAPVVDYSRAPPPKKSESVPLTSVVVLGDSMADWLAYGLETAAVESPDIGIARKHRTLSGLIRQEVRHDPRGEHPDWPTAAREILAAEKANYVVMMIGLNDRRPIRERSVAREPSPQGATATQPSTPQSAVPERPKSKEEGASSEDPPPVAEAPSPPPEPVKPGTAAHEFRSEKWAELYIKRIDETIAALKSKNVPVFWVGLPPIRGTKSSGDVSYLNDLYRSRAEKAGITYIDVWDGFVDEAGRFVTYGPDFEGQTRRLRTGDGVYFTQAGARKLAHFVEREIQRSMMTRATPVALPVPDEPTPQTPVARPGNSVARPLAGPVVPLTAVGEADELVGAGGARQSVTDAVAVRVLVKGEPMPAPAGRADDFAWPRRAVAPVGADPVVASTNIPMTPMRSEERPASAAPAGSVATLPVRPGASRPSVAGANQTGLRPPAPIGQQQARPDPRRYVPPPRQPFFFPFFGR